MHNIIMTQYIQVVHAQVRPSHFLPLKEVVTKPEKLAMMNRNMEINK